MWSYYLLIHEEGLQGVRKKPGLIFQQWHNVHPPWNDASALSALNSSCSLHWVCMVQNQIEIRMSHGALIGSQSSQITSAQLHDVITPLFCWPAPDTRKSVALSGNCTLFSPSSHVHKRVESPCYTLAEFQAWVRGLYVTHIVAETDWERFALQVL